MVLSLPTFNKKLWNSCIPTDLIGLRMLFPGRRIMLCKCKETTVNDVRQLVERAAKELETTQQGAQCTYIAFCNPVIVVGTGENERCIKGCDDPLLGRLRPCFGFNGSQVYLYCRKYECIAPSFTGDFTIYDIISNEKGYVLVTPYIRIDIAGRIVLYDLSADAFYLDGDVSAHLPEKHEEERKKHIAELKYVFKELSKRKEKDEAAERKKFEEAAEKKKLEEERRRYEEEAKRAFEEEKLRIEEEREKERLLKEKEALIDDADESTPKGYKNYTVKQLFPYAVSLRSALTIALSLCIISLLAEILIVSSWFEDLSSVDYGTLTFSALITGAVLLESATAAVYVSSFLSIKKIFTKFSLMSYRRRRSIDMAETLCVRKSVPMRVNLYYIFIVLHIVTRLAFLLFSGTICEELYAILRFGA